MFAFSRAALWVVIAAQFLVPGIADAQNYSMSYARMLTSDEARQVLHCPWCSYPASDDPTYFVRTAEGLNLALTDSIAARDAAELLNAMVRAKDRCDKTGYERAFDEYAKTMGLGEQSKTQDRMEIDGVFRLLNPRRDLSSLAAYMVPPFRVCRPHRIAKTKANLNMAQRAQIRWSGR
jgi:hypothetical protein